MKPKNKLQREILKLSQGLSPLTEYQRKRAIAKAAPHIAKYNSKKQYVCLDCGHSWTGVEATKVVCPHCLTKLEVDKGRKWNYCDRAYIAVVTKCKGYQVVRMYMMQTNLKKGKPATYWFGEAFQRWFDAKGCDLIIGRSRLWPARYYDTWNWESDLEIRTENYAHQIGPWKVVGHSSVIPEVRRNGYNGDFHDCSPYTLFRKLLYDNKTETMWKAGQYELVAYSFKESWNFQKYWPSVRIALRHNYKIKDPSLWFDLLHSLNYLDKDLRNPVFICPENLKASHDLWLARKDAKMAKEAAERERRRQMDEEQRYLENQKQARKDEINYRKSKSKFFDLEFVDKEITVKPLKSVREFLDEAHLMHHCVFSNGYYKKPNVLVFHALVEDKSVATIEFSLDNFSVIQCRGAYNSKPEQYDRIVALIKNNTPKIMSKTA